MHEAGITADYFSGQETKVLAFINRHFEDHGVLPKFRTVEEETEVKFPKFPDEPIGYWIDVVRRRAKSNLVSETFKSVKAATLEGDFDEIEKLARNLLVGLEQRGRNGNRPELRTFAQIIAMPRDERPSVIAGILNSEDSLLITGPSAIGKSILTLHLALALASGSDFFGRQTGGPYKVLLVQSEVGFATFQDRVRRLAHDFSGRRRRALENISSVQFAGALADRYGNTTGFMDQLSSWMAESESQVLILDPLSSFIGCDEKDNSAMRRTLDSLSAVCRKHGITPVIIHHHGKPIISKGKTLEQEGYYKSRSATSITDWARAIITLTRISLKAGRGNRIKAEFTKLQGRPHEPFTMEMEDGGTFRLVGEGPGSEDIRRVLEQRGV